MAGYGRNKRSSPGYQRLRMRLSLVSRRREEIERKNTKRTRYHPFVAEYKIRADAAARIEPHMAAGSRVICISFHDDIFIAKAVRASDDYLGRYHWRTLLVRFYKESG